MKYRLLILLALLLPLSACVIADDGYVRPYASVQYSYTTGRVVDHRPHSNYYYAPPRYHVTPPRHRPHVGPGRWSDQPDHRYDPNYNRYRVDPDGRRRYHDVNCRNREDYRRYDICKRIR